MDIHLDTSWCPVCDRLILPKRYSVPISPPHIPASQLAPSVSTTAVRQSQTTRGKNGTIKARGGGGGLVHGTGRVRPGGGLRTTAGNKNKSPLRQEQQQIQQIQQQLAEAQSAAAAAAAAAGPVRMRTVIDQAQTPLYCSDECRQADLDMSWPVAPPSARAVLDAEMDSHVRSSYLGPHPSQLNPAHASPPPTSPILPPVPPNSWRGPGLKSRDLDLVLPAAVQLQLSISENDGEHSDSSSTTDTSFTASDRSPSEEKPNTIGGLFSNLALPPIPPLPLHPHRASAPVAELPSHVSEDAQRKPLFEGGFMSAARRLQALFSTALPEDDYAREQRRIREEKERVDEERMAKWDLTGERNRDGSKERLAKEKKVREAAMARANAFNPVKLNYSATSSPAGVASTHRRPSDSNPPTHRVAAPGTPSRSQSALELYAKYPLFSRATPSAAPVAASRTKSSASLATSFAPAYGVTTLSTSPSARSATSSSTSHTAGLDESRSALTLPGVDPALYAGKRLGTPRRSIAKGVEGMLCVPDVLLRPTPAPAAAVSSSLPATGIASAGSVARNMRRSGSEASVSRKSERRSRRRSSSKLGAVREGDEGVWYRPEEEASEDSRSTATSTSGKTGGKREKVRKASKVRSATSESSTQARAGLKTEARNWSYDNVEGPMYNIIPPLPVKQTRCEEIFIPDELPTPVSTSAPTTSTDAITYEGRHVAISNLHTRDVELGRRALREIGRRRGTHENVPGWWVEHEWEVTVIPEPKRLFLFGSGTGRTR